MKIKTLLIIALSVMLILPSCKDDDTILPIGSLTATIGGNSWKALTRLTVLESGNFVITGTAADGSILAITILGETAGTYSFDISLTNIEVKLSGIYNPNATSSDSDKYYVTKGTLNLDNVDTANKKISGTFNLEVSKKDGESILETINITNGNFSNLKYQ